jgi:hypothetical protein
MASTRLAATWPAAIIAACCVLFQAGPAAADDVPSGCKPPPEKVAVDTTPPINIGILANALIYYRCTDYDADVTAALGAARAWVGKRAPEVAKPAIVLDIDETSLSNWEEIFRNDFGYIPYGACDLNAQSACGEHAWELSARAVAIEPTLELFNFAQTLKGKNGEPVDIYFITGRFEDPVERAATERNLHKVGMTNGVNCSCATPARALRMFPYIKPGHARKSRPITSSSPMSAISSAIWSAIKAAITPSDASRSPIRSISSPAIRSRARA